MWWLAVDVPASSTDPIGQTAVLIGAIAAALVPICGLVGIIWSKREPKHPASSAAGENSNGLSLVRERTAVNENEIKNLNIDLEDLSESVGILDRGQGHLSREVESIVHHLDRHHEGWRGDGRPSS